MANNASAAAKAAASNAKVAKAASATKAKATNAKLDNQPVATPVTQRPAGTPALPTAQPGSDPGVAPTAGIAPFLTPSQAAAEQGDYASYQNNVTGLQGQYDAAPSDELKQEAAARYASAVSDANQNALEAARNMFGSGINASQLADINTTLSTNLATYQTNLGNLQSELQGKIASAGIDWNNEQLFYGGLATENAQGGTPPVAPTPAPAAPAAPPAVPTGVQKPVAAGVGAVAKGVGAVTGVKQPPPPKPTPVQAGIAAVAKGIMAVKNPGTATPKFGQAPVRSPLASNFSGSIKRV
jgi:hypothetical protein